MSITSLGDLQFSLTAAAYIFVPLCALAGAFFLRVYRPGSILGPQRLAPGETVRPLALACGTGAFVWFFTQVVYLSLLSRGGKPISVNDLTPAQMGFLSTVPGLLGLAALLLADVLMDRRLPAKLGGSQPIHIGAIEGLLGILITYPIVALVMQISLVLYQVLHVTHPAEHELLKDLQEAHSPHLKALLIVAATVLAPLFEELLFRGHVQTLIKQLLIGWSHRGVPWARPAQASAAPPPMAQADGTFAVPLPGSLGAALENPPQPSPQPPLLPPAIPGVASLAPLAPPPPLSYESPPRPPRLIWQSWVAVVLTSLAFASLHDPWMWPGIFVLSIALGYVYERTGNLWANITMHLLFNGVNTVMFLMSR